MIEFILWGLVVLIVLGSMATINNIGKEKPVMTAPVAIVIVTINLIFGVALVLKLLNG